MRRWANSREPRLVELVKGVCFEIGEEWYENLYSLQSFVFLHIYYIYLLMLIQIFSASFSEKQIWFVYHQFCLWTFATTSFNDKIRHTHTHCYFFVFQLQFLTATEILLINILHQIIFICYVSNNFYYKVNLARWYIELRANTHFEKHTKKELTQVLYLNLLYVKKKEKKCIMESFCLVAIFLSVAGSWRIWLF